MNTYAQHIRACIFVKETFIKFKSNIKSHTLTVGDFNTQLLPMGRSDQQKFNREIRELTDAMTQMDLTDIYQTFHTNTKEYTFFSAHHGTLSKTEHILRNQENHRRYKK